MRLCASFFLYLLYIPAALFAQERVPDDTDEFIRKAMEAFNVPGASVSVVHNDTIRFLEGYGVRSITGNEAVDEETLFAIGSISKSTVAVALGMLMDEGLLHWDDKVIDHLPWFRMSDPTVTASMTIRDLLTHRSGLKAVAGGTVWYGSDYSRRDLVERFTYLEPVSPFRYKYAYQNIMYVAAGEIIPAVTGSTWDAFVQERLFDPLGMNRSNTEFGRLLRDRNKAMPHMILDGELREIKIRNHDNCGPAASINASAEDMAAYMQLLLGGGWWNEQRLYSAAVAKELFTQQMVIPIYPPMAGIDRLDTQYKGYGLGWFLSQFAGKKLVYHSGGVDGYRALALMIPEEKLGVCVLSNQEERGFYYSVGYSLLDRYLGLEPVDYLTPLAAMREQSLKDAAEEQAALEASRITGTAPSKPASDYAGAYRKRMYGDLLINEADGGLTLYFTHTPAFTASLEHWHYDTFRLLWHDPVIPDGFITFAFDADGEVTGFTLDQPNLLDVDFTELGDIVKVKE